MICLPFFCRLLLLVTSLTVGCAYGQTSLTPATSWGTWLIETLQVPAGEKQMGGFLELQTRSNSVMSQFFFFDIKGGINYQIDRNVSVMLAGAKVATYDYKDLSTNPLNTETRLWEQLTLTQYLTRLKFEHRYRVEQRWFTFRDGTQPYRNRIRYRLNLFLPLNNVTITDNTIFLSLYDEVFLNPIGPTFERNRLYAGVGYQLNGHWVAQMGWLNQTNYDAATFSQGLFTPQQASGKNNLVVGVIYRIKRPGRTEKLPSQPD